MKNEDLIDAMNYIDDDIIENAVTPKKKNRAVKWIAIAACFCLCIAVGTAFAINNSKNNIKDIGKEPSYSSEDGVFIPKSEFSIPEKGAAADCIPFICYKDCFYVYFFSNENIDLTDEYLGEAKNVIECGRQTTELNIDFNGSVEGKAYTVKGYSPDFMLAVKSEYSIFYLVKNNDITLNYGKELFEDSLHLKGNIEDVKYQSRYDWYYDNGNMKKVDKSLDEFLDAINNAKFMPSSAIPYNTSSDNIYDGAEIFHLTIKKTDGLTVELRCFEGGYVMFTGIDAVVKIDESIMNSLIP